MHAAAFRRQRDVIHHLPTIGPRVVATVVIDCVLTEQLERENNNVAGTLAYLAPEAWLGSRMGVRGDLYALGVLAYEITAGQLPFDTSTSVRMLKAKTERPRDLRELRADVSAEYARLVRELLMPEPASRPASAIEVAARLSEFADIDFHPDPTVYLRTPALVGRNRELDELRDAITEACSGKPTPTIVVGPAGAGKTRLLDEVLLEMGLKGAVIARATGRGFAGRPYEVLQELIAPLLHLPAAEGVLSRIGGKRALGPMSRLLGAAVAVTIAVAITALINVLRLRRRPLYLTLERLLDSFATTTYLSNCYNYSGHSQFALLAAERLVPFVYSRRRMPRVGYLMARVYALCLMNRFDESAAGCEEALAVVKHDRKTPVSEHDRVHATGGALITLLWIDLVRGYAGRSRWWRPFEQCVVEHPTALLESWLMEVRVFAAYRQGNLAETEAAWKQFGEKAAQAEVMFVQNKTKVWVGMAYLDFGRTSEAQDMADEVIGVASSPQNPFILALGLQLRAMALHAWEQLDDAENCLEQAAQLSRQADVASWELHHSILLSQALLMLDRGNVNRAKELASLVEARNASLRLKHDLHCCRANRILGRVALAEGFAEEAVDRLEKAVSLASEMDDKLERARSYHFLAQALSARSDMQYAERCKHECSQLLNELGNGYQLRRLGYISADGPESGDGVSLLSRSLQFSTDSDLKSTLRQAGTALTGSGPVQPLPNSLLDLSDAALRDDTLVAVSQNEPLSNKSIQ